MRKARRKLRLLRRLRVLRFSSAWWFLDVMRNASKSVRCQNSGYAWRLSWAIGPMASRANEAPPARFQASNADVTRRARKWSAEVECWGKLLEEQSRRRRDDIHPADSDRFGDRSGFIVWRIDTGSRRERFVVGARSSTYSPAQLGSFSHVR